MKEGKMKIRMEVRMALCPNNRIADCNFIFYNCKILVLGFRVGCSLIGFLFGILRNFLGWLRMVFYLPVLYSPIFAKNYGFSLLINVCFSFYPGDITPYGIGSFIIGVYADDIKSVIPKL
jgi:hypothetical protein